MEQLKMRYETYLLKHKAKQNRGAKYSRDTERLKTYKSEWAFQSRAEIPDFKNLTDAQNFANKLYKSKTWIKLWKKSVEEDVGKIFSGQPQVVGMSRRSKTMSGYTNGTTVTLCPTTGMNKYVLLHELAHCPRTYAPRPFVPSMRPESGWCIYGCKREEDSQGRI